MDIPGYREGKLQIFELELTGYKIFLRPKINEIFRSLPPMGPCPYTNGRSRKDPRGCFVNSWPENPVTLSLSIILGSANNYCFVLS